MFVLGDEDKDKEVFAPASHDLSLPVLRVQSGPAQLRELPLRYSETSTLFRNEDSGEMHA